MPLQRILETHVSIMQEYVMGTSAQPDNAHEQDFKRLECLLDNVNTAHCIYDIAHGKLAFVSVSLSELFGLEHNRLLKEWPGIMNQLVPAEHHPAMEMALQNWFMPYLNSFMKADELRMLCLEFPIRTEQGQLVWILQQVVPLAWNTDRVLTQCAFLVTDTTETALQEQRQPFHAYLKSFTRLN